MSNNFIVIEMNNNAFVTDMSVSIPDLGINVCTCKCKIDTGCSYSTIPFFRLEPLMNNALELKSKDIFNKVPYMQTYGVESGGDTHSKPQTFDEKMECPALKFKHKMINVNFNGYAVGDFDVHINYDRRGNILIGMDILKEFIIYMDVSIVTGKETLIMMLRSEENTSDFYRECAKHFGITSISSVYAEGIRNAFSNNRVKPKDISDKHLLGMTKRFQKAYEGLNTDE